MTSSSSSSSSLKLSPLPGVIGALSFLHLLNTGFMSDATLAFFDLNLITQVACLSFLFAMVFFFVELALHGGGGLSLTKSKTPKSRGLPNTSSSNTFALGLATSTTSPAQLTYPLEALEKCQSDKEKFLLLFPTLRDQILSYLSSHVSNHDLPPNHEALQWLSAMMDYNVPKGKLNRGLTVVDVRRTMLRASSSSSSDDNTTIDLTPLQFSQAAVLGWAIEFLQAFFLVADDVMDESETRRNQPCWYKLRHVGIIAVNDAFLLESFVFALLKMGFASEEYYGELVELFLDVIQRTEVGQLMDLTSQPLDAAGGNNTTTTTTTENNGDTSNKQPTTDWSRFTIERHALIVKYKTAFYTFYLPVAIGMITSGVTKKEAYVLAKELCCQIGEYFQIQDDYLDCFGDPETIGKVGTDIQDNKCSWLIVQALSRATPTQKAILYDNYGSWNDAQVSKVKQVYQALELPKVFAEYEEKSYQGILGELEKVEELPKEVFRLLLKRIYKRSK